MKRYSVLVVIVLLAVCIVNWLGVGYWSSGSAVSDLKAELEALHGEEYTGRPVENGTEDMVFLVEPRTLFLTNWNVRDSLGLDYEYACKVIVTTYADGEPVKVRTITYRGYDPMGAGQTTDRAYVDPDSRTETETAY